MQGETKNYSNQDVEQLLEAMKALGQGSFRDIERDKFENPELADTFNNMLGGLMDRNNRYLARINDAQTRIADLTELKNIFEQITDQQNIVSSLKTAKNSMGKSYDELSQNSNELLALSKQLRNAFTPFINELLEGSDHIEKSIQDFSTLLDATNHLHDVIIANTTTSGPIEDSRKALLQSVLDFENVYNQTLSYLSDCSALLSRAHDVFEGNNSRLVSISLDVKNVYNHMREQAATTDRILEDASSVIDSYDKVTVDGFQLGRHLFRISRDIDNCRNDLFRQNSRPTLHDTLRIFEVDHLTLAWRVYNHLRDFETLKITQLNNPNGCKLGLWLNQQSDPKIGATVGFQKISLLHTTLHEHAVKCYEAKEAYNMPLAQQEFTLLLNTMMELRTAMDDFHQYLHSIGISAETEIWHFKE